MQQQQIKGLSQSPDQQEEPKMKWTSRIVSDAVGEAGSVEFDN